MSLCPNCGIQGWKEKVEDYHCESCGYKTVKNRVIADPISLVFCEGCGVTYSTGCPNHDASKQKPVNPNKP
jgi:NMD protein affecting ribosome stability and mRNA decay